MRLLHFSDVHVPSPIRGVPLRAIANRRLAGLLNYRLRRRKRYLDAPRKLQELAETIHDLRVDVALCTGDYTIVGLEPELAFARRCVQPIVDAAPEFVTIFGNHDVYMPDSLGVFEKHFGEFLKTDRPDLAVDGVWPLVRFLGDHVAVVGINSARPKPDVVRSTGRVPEAQLAALPAVLDACEGRFVFLLTHYAPRLGDGRPDKRNHGLENADELLQATGKVRGALLFGHVHHQYDVSVPETAMHLFNSGSTTMKGHEGFWLYEVGDEVVATPGVYRDGRYVLLDRQVVVQR
ncbi:MAG: metallophosphoesterase [Myxococcota bacterium]